MAASAETVVRTLQAVAPSEAAQPSASSARWARPWAVRALLVSLALVTLPALAFAARHMLQHPAIGPLLFIVAAFALGIVRLEAYGSVVVPSPVAVVAAAAIGGPLAGLLAGAVTGIGAFARFPNRHTARARIASSFFAMTLAGGASGLPFVLASLSTRPSWLWLPLLGALAAALLYTTNAVIVCLFIAWTGGGSARAAWYERFRWMMPQTTALCLTGSGLAAAYHAVGVYEIAAFAMPVAGMYVAWQQYLAHTRQSVEDLRTKNADLVTMASHLRTANEKLTTTYRGTLEALIGALDARDNETEGHSYRVSAYSQIMAEQMGVERGSSEWETIARGALLHDVGKVGVRDAVLLKPSGLTEDEWVEMRGHAGIGYGILAQVEFLRPAAELVWAHHEKYDGGGYPRGLKGEEIPLGSRIFSVADAFDAMTSDRPYRKAMPPHMALDELRRCAGTQFDPRVVAVFERVWEQIWSARSRARQMVA